MCRNLREGPGWEICGWVCRTCQLLAGIPRSSITFLVLQQTRFHPPWPLSEWISGLLSLTLSLPPRSRLNLRSEGGKTWTTWRSGLVPLNGTLNAVPSPHLPLVRTARCCPNTLCPVWLLLQTGVSAHLPRSHIITCLLHPQGWAPWVLCSPHSSK